MKKQTPDFLEILKILSNSDQFQEHEDGTRHFLKQIPEFGNRWLRIVINVEIEREKAVTAFFDRRLRSTE